jgi:uncharacterized protein
MKKSKTNPAVFLLSLPIKFYRAVISPIKGGPCCRFTPTCSQYALEALSEWGAVRGSFLALKRVLKCNPFGPYGYDPVPENPKKKKEREKCRQPSVDRPTDEKP